VGTLSSAKSAPALRESEGESLAQFPERLGITRTQLSDIENGRRAVGLERAARFAVALGQNEAQFVRLALQDQVREAGLKLRVEVHAT
jgi:transcriptional regulator with XRE-family HTH domain